MSQIKRLNMQCQSTGLFWEPKIDHIIALQTADCKYLSYRWSLQTVYSLSQCAWAGVHSTNSASLNHRPAMNANHENQSSISTLYAKLQYNMDAMNTLTFKIIPL